MAWMVWGVLVRYSVECPSIGVYMFFSWLDWVYVFCRGIKGHFHDTKGAPLMLILIIWDSPCQASLLWGCFFTPSLPLFHTVLLGRKSLYTIHTSGDTSEMWSIYINYLKSFYMGDFSFLPHLFIPSFASVLSHGYFILWLIIQTILLLRVSHLWPMHGILVGSSVLWHTSIIVVLFPQYSLCIFCPSYSIIKDAWFLASGACYYWSAIAYRPSQLKEHGSKEVCTSSCIHRYIYRYLYICIFTLMSPTITHHHMDHSSFLPLLFCTLTCQPSEKSSSCSWTSICWIVQFNYMCLEMSEFLTTPSMGNSFIN